MPRISNATKSGPCSRCADTASTIPSNGNTESKPLHVAPIDAARLVTASVNSAPATMRSTRSPKPARVAGTCPVARGKPHCETATATQATATAHASDAGSRVNNNAATNHPLMPATNASGHEKRRQLHAYAKLKASDAAIAAIDATDACAANDGPRASASSSTIGPATTGRPASQPATDGPHKRAAIVSAARNAGTSASLSASMLNLPARAQSADPARATTQQRAYKAPPKSTAQRTPSRCPPDRSRPTPCP